MKRPEKDPSRSDIIGFIIKDNIFAKEASPCYDPFQLKRLDIKMTTMKRTERLFDLNARFERGAQLTIERLCSDYQINRRTASRDLHDLKAIGCPLQAEQADDGTKIWSAHLDHRKIRVSYNLTDLTALLMGRKLFDFLTGTLLEESLNKIYESIETAQDGKKNYLGVKNLASKVHLISEAPKLLDKKNVDCLDDCLTALLGEKLLNFEYVNAKGEHRKRCVEPLTLVAFRRGLYLLARGNGTKEIRTYALERIQEAQWVKGSRFAYPQDFDPKKHFEKALFMTIGEPQKVVLEFTPATEPFIKIRRFHESQKTKKNSDGSIEITLRVPIEDELLYWALSFGANILVKEPKELRLKLKDALEKTLKQYQ